MNSSEKKLNILKKIILIILFIAFWVLLAINIFKRDDNKGLAFLRKVIAKCTKEKSR